MSFYTKIDLSYEKFNNNYIKCDFIMEFCTLSGNIFCFLINIGIFVLYDKDLSLKSKYLNFGLLLYFKCIIFQISNNEIVLVIRLIFEFGLYFVRPLLMRKDLLMIMIMVIIFINI